MISRWRWQSKHNGKENESDYIGFLKRKNIGPLEDTEKEG